ncbi:amino acid ABC transporter substrate-binding protein [Clostridium thermarum]|uniref:amino acid ABC transporter substrate-binding protein n=1 Tax=Clostridium thermarum TaxID=1716543 RepID=UPI00111CBBB0|nr:amino acid ABC transporter substrate-binding protein [Clostridium thermarum]
MKKKIFTLCLTAVLALGTLSGCNNKSEDSWKKIQEKKTFVLGLDASFPPMGFTDDDNNIVGFDIDLAKEVFDRLGIELKLQPIDWNAKEQELNTGNIDAIWNGFTITEDRKKQVLFSEPYMKNRQVLVVNSNSSFSTLKELEGKKLGLQAGSSAADALEKSQDFRKSLKEVVEFKDNMMALMDLEKGGVDAVLMDEIVARYYIQKKDKSYKVLDEALAEEEYGIGFRKKDKELMEKVQETLQAMAEDGKAAEISNNWFGEDITTIKK